MNQVRVGIGVLIRKNGKYLLYKRIGSHGEGTWAPPGGHLELFETIEDCAKRETKEEFGIKINNVKILAISEERYPRLQKHYINITVTAQIDIGEPKLLEPEKMVELGWFSPSNFPKPLFTPLKLILAGKGFPKKVKL